MGSMSVQSRVRMEAEATEEAVRLIEGKPLEASVPEEEYANQMMSLSWLYGVGGTSILVNSFVKSILISPIDSEIVWSDE